MKLFTRQTILRDPNTEDVGSSASEEPIVETSMEDLISESLSNEPEEGIETEVPDENTENQESENEETVEKPVEKPEEPVEDPELDLGYEEDGKPVTMKTSEVIANIKWLKQNMQSLGGMLKVRELAGKNPEFSKLMNLVIQKSVGENDTINNDYVTNSLKALEVKAENIEEKIEDKDDDIEEAEAILEELDPESSQAMLIKKQIKIMKNQKALLKDQSDKISKIAEKLDGMDQKTTDAAKKAEDQKHQEAVSKASKTFNTEYESLTKDNIEFIDDSEKQRFENQVKKLVAGQSAKIANDEDFKKVIGESVKIAKKELEDYHEAIRNDYLRKKKKLPKDKPEETIIAPDEELTQDALEKELERQLSEDAEKE